MGKNSKKLIIALVVIIVAAVVVTFSFSLFTSSSANPGNMVGSGTMEINNSDEGPAILTVDGLLPGESGDGTVTITNVGDSEGDFSMTTANLVDTPADPAFSSVLTLVITDGATEVYNGPIAAVGTVDLGTWAARRHAHLHLHGDLRRRGRKRVPERADDPRLHLGRRTGHRLRRGMAPASGPPERVGRRWRSSGTAA